MNNITIRLETPSDYRKVEELTRRAFWNVYKPGADEHYFAHAMRNHKDFLPELSFAAELDGEIIGSILYTKAHLVDDEGSKKEIVSFGPISVDPRFQRKGISRMLIERSFEAARQMGYGAAVIFGNPANYVGRGFVSCKKMNVTLGESNFPTALLVCELIPGALGGKHWRYIPSDADTCVLDTAAVDAFDATFPPMEKAWAPSQEEFYIYSHSSVVR
ncbi:MAG: N-acetyltransferase [Clostridiales bacterium]|nr:N-acetyltransferase [Clostridiales bacterium]